MVAVNVCPRNVSFKHGFEYSFKISLDLFGGVLAKALVAAHKHKVGVCVGNESFYSLHKLGVAVGPGMKIRYHKYSELTVSVEFKYGLWHKRTSEIINSKE